MVKSGTPGMAGILSNLRADSCDPFASREGTRLCMAFTHVAGERKHRARIQPGDLTFGSAPERLIFLDDNGWFAFRLGRPCDAVKKAIRRLATGLCRKSRRS